MVIDMQNQFVQELRWGEAKRIVPRQIVILKKCLLLKIPIILVEYRGSGSTIPPLNDILQKKPRVYTIRKKADDGFTNPRLPRLLQRLRTSTIIIMGINADACVKDTARSASQQGHRIITSNDLLSGPDHHSHNNNGPWFQKNSAWLSSLKILKALDNI